MSADEKRVLGLHKAPTTPHDPFAGLEAALRLAARAESLLVEALLGATRTSAYATTHAINAVLEGKVAPTAFLCKQGRPDILVYREGGKPQPLNLALPYPDPYVPRSLTFELPGRVLADASVRAPLDEARVRAILARLAELDVEAVGVCLLWSVANPAHELRVGELLEECLPGEPYTLNHCLNPVNREYRRASATVIDASLKPILRALASRASCSRSRIPRAACSRCTRWRRCPPRGG